MAGSLSNGSASSLVALPSNKMNNERRMVTVESPSGKQMVSSGRSSQVKKEIVTVVNTKRGPEIQDLVITKPKARINNQVGNGVVRGVRYVNAKAPKRRENDFYYDKVVRGNNWVNKK